MDVVEDWKDAREYWSGRRLTEAEPFQIKFVSNETWEVVPPIKETDRLNFIEKDDQLISYSDFLEAKECLMNNRLLRRLGGGDRFFEERYLSGKVNIIYSDQHTFRELGVYAIQLQTSDCESLEEFVEMLGLSI